MSKPWMTGGALVLVVLALAGCAPESDEPGAESSPSTSVRIEKDLSYGSADGEDLLLDACLPAATDDGPAAAVVLVHGGAFQEGSKSSGGMPEICRQAAERGIAAFAIDYRMAPEFTYPAQVDDLSTAVAWLRETAQSEQFGIDPGRIGVFGSSAGAIMAASVGTAGEGDTSEGARVSAVAALSPAVDFTPAGLALGKPSKEAAGIVAQYLGCRSITDCPSAEAASPIYSVDPSDPPFFIAASEDEIVPIEQGEAMRDALEAAGVPVDFVSEAGSKHGVQLLTSSIRSDIFDFFSENLAAD